MSLFPNLINFFKFLLTFLPLYLPKQKIVFFLEVPGIGNDVFKKTSVLSGGERNRVALAKLLMTPCNFLVMDEPTNHLDIRSKEVLQEALNLFEGTALIVSHDRSFLDGVVTKVLEISTNTARMLTCNVTEYMERLEVEAD